MNLSGWMSLSGHFIGLFQSESFLNMVNLSQTIKIIRENHMKISL